MTAQGQPELCGCPESNISWPHNNLGAVITGGQQHIGLAIVGAYRVHRLLCLLSKSEIAHPSIVVQMTLREGERILFALGVGRSLQAARRLVEDELHQRNFDAELSPYLALLA